MRSALALLACTSFFAALGCGGGSHGSVDDAAVAQDAAHATDAARPDAMVGSDAGIALDAASTSDAGSDECAGLAWLNGMFTCTDGTHLTCTLFTPGMFGAGTCDLQCTSPTGDTGYVGFGNMGRDPSDITLHPTTGFDELKPPRSCTKP